MLRVCAAAAECTTPLVMLRGGLGYGGMGLHRPRRALSRSMHSACRQHPQAAARVGAARGVGSLAPDARLGLALLTTRRAAHTAGPGEGEGGETRARPPQPTTATTAAPDLQALETEWQHLRAEARLMKGAEAEAEAAAEAPASPPHTAWPEPTLADLDRSIPQVDCEFVAHLIRSRNLHRDAFLTRKSAVKARVEELTRRTTRTVEEAVALPRVGGLNLWRGRVADALQEGQETALAATSAHAPVLASEEVLAQLTREERDALQTTRPEYDDGFILLDCRTVNEVTSWGVIEGAKVLPAHELFEAFHSTPEDFLEEYGFPKPHPEDMIICYCQYGPRSLMAAQILSWMGYLKVLHFRDGYYEWGKQYNLLLRRWMEHDRTSGNELRRVATFRAALEMQREIAPEFNALPMKEAAQYQIDTTRSRGTLLVGDGLRREAYLAVAKLMEGLPETSAPPGLLEDSEQSEISRRGQHLTQFLEQTTGLNPLEEADAESGVSVGEAQAIAVDALTEGGSPSGEALRR